MNQIFQSNNYNNITSIITDKEKYIIINGIKYKLPKYIKGTHITQINNHVYIDGYEFKNGKFKKTLKSLFHLFF